jgi:hypothetical protein
MTPKEKLTIILNVCGAGADTKREALDILDQVAQESRRQALREAIEIINAQSWPWNDGPELVAKGCAEAIKSLMDKS